ncbi:hypothetical protein OH77DRAFT_1016982 [Trametes cingulata]|nr:hypothetical protein OH77DRAFT_1016982 [Trametes cingulata]
MYPQYPSHIVAAASNFAYDSPELEGYQVNTTCHGAFEPAFLVYLAAKPRLRKAFVHLGLDDAEDVTACFISAHIYHPFQSLQHLWLKVTRLNLCTALIESMSDCRLFSVTFEVEKRPLAKDVSHLFDVLHKRCDRHTLHVLRLIQFSLGEDGQFNAYYPDYLVDMAVLQPLLDFSNMRAFSFGIPMLGWLGDDDLRVIGDAWPGLVTFDFLKSWTSPHINAATWKGVIALVSRTPLLADLTVHFDARRNLITGPEEIPDVRPNQELCFFDMSNSILPSDPAPFALTLFTIAPRVARVNGFGWSCRCPCACEEDAPPMDPYAFCEQVDKIMCRLRAQHFGDEYTLDRFGRIEIMDDAVECQPSEWNPWR